MTSSPLPPPPQTDRVQGTSLVCNDTLSQMSDFKDVGRSTMNCVSIIRFLLGHYLLCFFTDLTCNDIVKLHPQPSDNKQDVGRSTLHFDYHVITVMV